MRIEKGDKQEQIDLHLWEMKGYENWLNLQVNLVFWIGKLARW